MRVNATALIIFRLRNVKELEALTEENPALVSRQRIREIYDVATREPDCFLYIDSAAKTVDTIFWKNFDHPSAP